VTIFTLHFEISCFGVWDEYLQRVNYISASEVYISDDRYIHRVRGFVEGEVLTNEFEMVENVFGPFSRAHRVRWTPHFGVSEIFSRCRYAICISINTTICHAGIESFIRDRHTKLPHAGVYRNKENKSVHKRALSYKINTVFV